jgi:hypothetical protein
VLLGVAALGNTEASPVGVFVGIRDGDIVGTTGVVGVAEAVGWAENTTSNPTSSDGAAEGGNLSGITKPGLPFMRILFIFINIVLSGITTPGPFIGALIESIELILPIPIRLGHEKNIRIGPFHINIGHVKCFRAVMDNDDKADDDIDDVIDFMNGNFMLDELLLRLFLYTVETMLLRQLLLMRLFLYIAPLRLIIELLRLGRRANDMLMLLNRDRPLRFDIFISDRRLGICLCDCAIRFCSSSTMLVSGLRFRYNSWAVSLHEPLPLLLDRIDVVMMHFLSLPKEATLLMDCFIIFSLVIKA